MKLRAGRSVAEVEGRGAYLSSLTLDGRQILLSSRDGRQTHGGACNLLPYAGRIRNGTYRFMGRRYSFPRGEDGNSIHGFARDREFEMSSPVGSSAVCYAVIGDDGYPSELNVGIRYDLSPGWFAVRYDVSNTGKASAPLVIGSHPYFLTEGRWRITPSSPAVRLRLADMYFPDGTTEEFDFGRYLNDVPLDSCFNGGGSLLLSSERGDLVVSRTGMDYFLVYNGEYALGRSVAIEPMTGAPDAYNNGIGLRVLAPRERYTCGYTVSLPQP